MKRLTKKFDGKVPPTSSGPGESSSPPLTCWIAFAFHLQMNSNIELPLISVGHATCQTIILKDTQSEREQINKEFT